MLTPPPDMYPGCTWADQPVTATTAFGIGTAAIVEPQTGLTTRYTVHAYDPHAQTALVTPEQREDRAGVGGGATPAAGPPPPRARGQHGGPRRGHPP
ncbi:hypothetical protein ACFW9F_18620, partial [Streptomyces sp. NPDC059506]